MNIAQARISGSALRHNLTELRRRAPASKVLAVIKANAYGHGMLAAATYLDQADSFAVARPTEALALREQGIVKPIVVLEGFFDGEDLQALSQHDIGAVVHSEQQLALLASQTLPKPLQVWLKLDTGMHRLGFHPQQFAGIYQQLLESDCVQPGLTVMTHLACADERENALTQQQLLCFEEQVRSFNSPCSIANSAGVLLHPHSHAQWNRPGIALYGVSPQVDSVGQDFNLRPVMSLQSRLIAIREHAAGESIGYGATWRAGRRTKIGVVAIGYGDGYPRTAENGTPVWVNGREVPLVGRVSMDMLCVDLGAKAQDRVGDEVILWGASLPVERIAMHANTIAYELLTRLTSRTRLIYDD